MTERPWAWRRIVRRLNGALAPDAAKTMLGDLLEDYRADRVRVGRARASWRAWRDARSIQRAYQKTPAPRGPWLGGLASDIRGAVRDAGRQPALTLGVVLTLTFAMASTTSLFSIVDGLLFRPLPFHQPEALVHLKLNEDTPRSQRFSVYRSLIEEVAASPLFTSVSLASSFAFYGAFSDDEASEAGIVPSEVSPGYFALLGVRLERGREFVPQDGPEGSPLSVVVGHDLWIRLLGGDEGVVDRTVTLAGRSVTVIGIAPAGLTYPLATNVWVPSGPPVTQVSARLWQVARLAPNVSIARVRAQFPDIDVTPLRDAIQPADTLGLIVLLSATGLLMVTTWVQIGSLLLSRAVNRLPDTSVRLALGAAPSRLARQHLLDATVLSTLALAAAWLSTPGLTQVLAGQLPAEITRGQSIAPDWRTFTFAAAASVMGAMLLAVSPSSLLHRLSGHELVSSGTGGITRRAERWRGALLVGQIACSSLLLCVAGLTFHSFVRVSRVDLGFDPSHLWEVRLPSRSAGLDAEARETERAERQADVDRALERLGEMPFVVAAGAADSGPVGQGLFRAAIYVPGREDPLDLEPQAQRVSAGYLRALAPRVIEGRLPDERPSTGVDEVLVNRAFARAFRARPEILKGELRLRGLGQIVGIVDDFVGPVPGSPDPPRIFVPLGRRASVLLIRLRDDQPQAIAAVRTVVAGIWGPSTGSRVTPVADQAAALGAPWRARTILLGLIAALGVPLVVAGLTGSLYASIRRRTRDIAIHLALGATAREVSRLIVWRALTHTGAGVVLGLGAAVAIGRVLSGVLFGVAPTDPATFAGVGCLMLAVAAIGSLLPARLAASIAPIEALRER